ncbi:2670_t:CDS:1, partial [Ambispora leptoticha]
NKKLNAKKAKSLTNSLPARTVNPKSNPSQSLSGIDPKEWLKTRKTWALSN